jgi:RNA polymerase sigma factor (sigma-70 family)
VTEEWVARLYPRIWSYLYGLTLDSHAADDLTQEAFFRYCRRYGAGPPATGALLYRIARNLVIDRRRGERSTVPLSDTWPAPPEDLDEWLDFRQALSTLTAVERDLLLLAAWSGLSGRECAALLGTSEGAVRKRLSLIRKKLRTALAGPDASQSGQGRR